LKANGKGTLLLPSASDTGLCSRWILLLLVRGLPTDEIDEALKEDDLPSPGIERLDEIRSECVPRNFRLKSPKNIAALEALGLLPFANNIVEAEKAMGLLRHARARELAEGALLLNVPPRAIVHALSAYLSYASSPGVVELFRSVFFDLPGTTRSQLKVLVQQRVRVAVMRAATNPDDQMAARRAIASDSRIVAASMPSSSLAWPVVLLAAGLSPGRRELAGMIDALQGLAATRASEAILRGGRGDERRAGGYITVMRDLHELRETCVTPEAELSKKLSAFQLRHSAEKVITIAQLREAGDGVTVDVQPLAVDAAE
jgi:hypothetical protein